MTMFSGIASVTLLSPSEIVEDPTVKSLVKQAGKDGLSGHQGCLLRPGESLYLPMGYVPLVVGMPSSIVSPAAATPKKSGRPPRGDKRPSADAEVKHVCYSISFAFGTADASTHNAALCNTVASMFQTRFSYCPIALRDCESAKEWQAALAAA